MKNGVRVSQIVLVVIVALALSSIAACRTREAMREDGSEPMVEYSAPPVQPRTAPKTTTPPPRQQTTTTAVKPALPVLDREPQLAVLLDSGSRISFRLQREASIAVGNSSRRFAPGTITAEATGSGIRVNGQVVAAADLVFEVGSTGQAVFSSTLTPPFGKPQALTFSGVPILHRDNGEVQLIERIGMEGYLAGVLPTEMNASWPLEALKAQAVAARSYAAARYSERYDQPWQLHWHYSVDMAYGGYRPNLANVRTALDQTRGQLLMVNQLPVLALFHASSGGSTEAFVNLWPDRRAADDRTSFQSVMPVVNDPSDEAGARGLNLVATHWRWKANLSMRDISDGLRGWSLEKPRERPQFGSVVSVKTDGRFNDSGRVAAVIIRHRLGKKEVETRLPAQDFRMAVGPGTVRSTFWDRCVMADKSGGTLVLEGRGFGHGVGLSQVSAWEMAKEGKGAMEILKRFYPGAGIVDRW